MDAEVEVEEGADFAHQTVVHEAVDTVDAVVDLLVEREMSIIPIAMILEVVIVAIEAIRGVGVGVRGVVVGISHVVARIVALHRHQGDEVVMAGERALLKRVGDGATQVAVVVGGGEARALIATVAVAGLTLGAVAEIVVEGDDRWMQGKWAHRMLEAWRSS